MESRNYLISVCAEIRSESEVESEAVDVAAILARMKGAGNRLELMVLDAGRDNQFGRGFRCRRRLESQMPADAPMVLPSPP